MPKTADRILELLYDRRDFVLLDELRGAAGGPGRLQAALAMLEARGHHFESHPLRGLRLLRPTVLDAGLIERGLKVRRIGLDVICFPSVASTNDVAFDAARHARGRARVVTAEAQTAGRGRLGRSWQCPAGSGILASVCLGQAGHELGSPSPMDRAWGPLPHEALTIAAGLAVAEGVEPGLSAHVQLEWPNDVVIEGQKLAGVLVEVRRRRSGADVVVGFGINVFDSPRGLGRPATHLAKWTEHPPERIEILRRVLVRLDEWIEQILAGRPGAPTATKCGWGPLTRLHRQWVARCGMLNQRLTFMSDGRKITGRVLDVDPLEGLLLADDLGRRLHLSAATTSVVRP